MSKDDLLNWSTVLRRISWWLQTGNILLAEKFIERGQKLYPAGTMVANRKWEWWMKEIQQVDTIKASEVALTWSLLIKNYTYLIKLR